MTPTSQTEQIATYYQALADATKECPCASCQLGDTEETCRCEGHPRCLGTGRVARFPEFRRACGHGQLGSQVWEVRAGGLEGALAGLSIQQAHQVFYQMRRWLTSLGSGVDMPSAQEILLKGLELVIKVTGLEVPV